MRLQHNLLAIFVTAIVFHSAVCAEDIESQFSEEDYFSEIPMVLSATRLEQPLSETPASVTIIDRETIEAMGIRNLADVFRIVPGFVVNYYNGHDPVVAYHGAAGNFFPQLQVLIDGRSVYLPSFGGVRWNDMAINLDDISKIEVIRGANASTYGTNAFIGVISITTHHAAEEQGHKITGTIGDHGVADSYYRYGGETGNLDYRFSFGFQSDNGFDKHNDNINNDSYEASRVNARFDYDIDSHSSITAQLGQARISKGTGETGTFDSVRNIDVDNQFQLIHWKNTKNEASHSIKVYHNVHHFQDAFTTNSLTGEISALLNAGTPCTVGQTPTGAGGCLTPGPFPLPDWRATLDFSRKSERFDIEYENQLKPTEKTRLLWGASYRTDKVTSKLLFNTTGSESLNITRLFGHGEYKKDAHNIFNFGLMLEDGTLIKHEISPKISYIHKPTRHHSIRFVASQATRIPVLLEEKGDTIFTIQPPPSTYAVPIPFDQDTVFASSGGLTPEKITSTEIGIHSEFSPSLTTDLRFFQDHSRDLIQKTKVTLAADTIKPGAADFENATENKINGVDLSIDYKPTQDARIIAAMTWQDLKSSDADINGSVPNQIFSLLISKKLSPVTTMNWSYYKTSQFSWLDGDVMPNTHWLNVAISRNFSKHGDRKLELIANDLFGDRLDYNKSNIRKPAILIRFSGAY